MFTLKNLARKGLMESMLDGMIIDRSKFPSAEMLEKYFCWS